MSVSTRESTTTSTSTEKPEKLTFTMLSVGRGIGTNYDLPVCNECLCLRPCCIVICYNCGFKAFGRIRYFCTKHPETRFLLDWPHCPNCKCFNSLKELNNLHA